MAAQEIRNIRVELVRRWKGSVKDVKWLLSAGQESEKTTDRSARGVLRLAPSLFYLVVCRQSSRLRR